MSTVANDLAMFNKVATHQKTQQGLKRRLGAGFEGIAYVATNQKTQQGLKPILFCADLAAVWSQRIRKPSRD